MERRRRRRSKDGGRGDILECVLSYKVRTCWFSAVGKRSVRRVVCRTSSRRTRSDLTPPSTAPRLLSVPLKTVTNQIKHVVLCWVRYEAGQTRLPGHKQS